jgi:hypothetical protein
MKNGIYTLMAIALVIGAILYSDSIVLGKEPDNRRPATSPSKTNATLTSKKKAGQNPAQAGASAAKPNGVPNCVACAPEKDAGAKEFNEGANELNGDKTENGNNQNNNNNLAEAPEPGPSSSGQPPPARKPRTAQSTASANQRAKAKAEAQGRGASAQAIAVNNTTVNHVTNTTVQRVQKIQPIETQEPVSAAVPQADVEQQPIEEPSEQPVAVQTVQPVVAQAAPVPVAQPLPATGNLALSGLFGTSAIGAAAYSYIKSRRRLERSSRKRQ